MLRVQGTARAGNGLERRSEGADIAATVAALRSRGVVFERVRPAQRSPALNEQLRAELVTMDDHDQTVRAELAAHGSLFKSYHPRMAAVHDANAARLREIIREHGWPTTALVGLDGTKAAHRIAQHSINHPDFMRECRALIKAASDRGEVPPEQFAYIDDRIRVYEGLPQLYGTQWRDGADGFEPYPVDDWHAVNQRRRDLGLPTLDEMRPKAAEPLSRWELERKRAEELAWRRGVGWIT